MAYTKTGTGCKITWSSSNKSIATVSAKAANGKSISVNVTISAKAVKAKKVALSGVSKSLAAGKSYTLKSKITPATATGAVPVYRSNNPKMAKADAAGRISALKPGSATITVTAGCRKATLRVRVR